MIEDDFNTLAWRDFIIYASRSREMREAFTQETGISLSTGPCSDVEKMRAATVGTPVVVFERFVEWVTVQHWGLEHAPKAYQDALAQRAGEA